MILVCPSSTIEVLGPTSIADFSLETDVEGLVPTLPAFGDMRGSNMSADFSLSPFGMELGEFMVDDDLVAMIEKQGLLPHNAGSAYAL